MATSWKQPFHDLRRTLAKGWVKLYRKTVVIGVTGSYGKTNTSRAIATVLSEKYSTLQTDLNLDTVYNIPITLLRLRSKHKFLILELGIDHKGEMNSYLELVRPHIGVLTGITPVHSEAELLGSLEGIIKEKGKLLEALPKTGWAILNWDNEHVHGMVEKTKAKVIRYGTTRECDFWAERVSVDFSGTSMLIRSNYPDLPFGESGLPVKIPLVGKHFTHEALVATIVGLINGLKLEEIVKGLSKLHPLRGRMSIEEGPLGSVLLNDALRANPVSTLAGLETLASLYTKGQKIAVLGEMGELGDYAETGHRLIGKKVANLGINLLIAIGPLQRFVVEEAIKAGMKKTNVFLVENVFEAAKVLKKSLRSGDIVYLKGSLLRHLERVVLLLKGEKVDCDLVVCHRYNQCLVCPLLRKQ